MKQYIDLVKDVLENGKPLNCESKKDRTGVGTYSVFGRQLRFNMQDGFPLVTTKKIHLRAIIYELLWFLKGDTNLKYLHENKVSIWDEWADEKQDLGPIYGKQWRKWEGKDGVVDQIENLIKTIKNNPDSRRMVVVSYNPGEIPVKAPPGCHSLFQLYVKDSKLSLQLYQRSADLMLGVPFNIASYALLLHMISHVTGLIPFEFIHTFGDVHIYTNHIEGAKEQIQRTPLKLPSLELNKNITNLFDFDFDDIKINNYNFLDPIKFDIAV